MLTEHKEKGSSNDSILNTEETENDESNSKRFSFIENVTPILIRNRKTNNKNNEDKQKWRSSLDKPLFRQPIEQWTNQQETESRGVYYDEEHHVSPGTQYGTTDPNSQGLYQKRFSDRLNQHKVPSTLLPIESYGSKSSSSKRHSARSIDAELSCDSDGGVSDDVSVFRTRSPSGGNGCYASYKTKPIEPVSTINVREMASFLEKTDSFIRFLEPASEKNRMNEVPGAPCPTRQINDRRSWGSDYSYEQISSLSRAISNRGENESSLQRMEQLIEIEKENARLKDRILRLQNRLERSEKENVQLREMLKQYYEKQNLREQGLDRDELNPATFEYSKTNLINVMNRIGIPEDGVTQVSIMIELEYQRNSKQNTLMKALSYSFDFMMRSLIEKEYEFGTTLSPSVKKVDGLLLPPFSEKFKDFVDILSQNTYQLFYDEIKRFVIDQWIRIFNFQGNQNGKTLAEILRDFCNTMETKIASAFGRDATCDLDDADVKEGLEQLVMNMLGGGVLNLMREESPKKEQILNRHIRVLQFLQPEHLEVKESYVNHPKFDLAIRHLRSMVYCRSPKHMLLCLSEATQTLFSILGSEHSSADDFLPLFIYCTLKSETLYLQTVSDYINQYRNPKDLVMGDGYMLVNLISSLQFISNIDASCLSINPIDYQMSCAAAEDTLRDEANTRLSLF